MAQAQLGGIHAMPTVKTLPRLETQTAPMLHGYLYAEIIAEDCTRDTIAELCDAFATAERRPIVDERFYAIDRGIFMGYRAVLILGAISPERFA